MSGQGTKIAIEVFATGVTTSLVGVRIEFDFDASVLAYVGARSSASLITLQNEATGTVLGTIASSPATLSESGFLARAEFTTTVDVTGREFSIGIKRVELFESGTLVDEITTTEVITFNDTAPSPDFNKDGIVDLADYDLFRNQWDKRADDPNWEAEYDLNGDGVIDLGDYAIFRDNWNKTFPVSPSDRGDDEEIVSIPDMNLRAVVEDSLNKASGAPISRGEMVTLTRLEAPNSNISDLTGLEFATRLKILNFGNEGGQNSNSIMDISALSDLTSLTYLNLNQNSIVDISPLSGLTNLTMLFLSINSIVDISPLSGLTSLTYLNLNQNSIVDISPLSGLTNLTVLFLSINSIVDISPLSGLTSLTELGLLHNSIVDISSLSGLTNLIELGLGNPFTGLPFVSNYNSITDIFPLSGLTSLTTLFLGNNAISDLAPLVANTGLGSGDEVNVKGNPLNATSLNTHIPALQERGVTVRF